MIGCIIIRNTATNLGNEGIFPRFQTEISARLEEDFELKG